MNRIAPNNQFPATHFIEVWSDGTTNNQQDRFYKKDFSTCNVFELFWLPENLQRTVRNNLYTVCLFRIRENKLPTKHKF